MRRIITAAALVVSALAIAAGPAAAAGQLCYDVQVNVNGEALVSESGCQELPA